MTKAQNQLPRRSDHAGWVHQIRTVAADLPLFLTAPLFRHWHRRWGATPSEIAAALPGDELLPRAQFRCTRAITIDAPPGEVWPWLVQVGCLRGGFYSNDLLDNLGHPSARTIIPELQHLRVGQWVPMSPGTPTVETAFTVAGLDVDRWLLWSKPDGTWAWMLTGLDNGTTRLVTRVHAVYDWRKPALALLGVVLMEFGDFAMMRRMLLGIKERAETVGRGQHPTPTTPSTHLSRPKTVRPQKAPMPGPRALTVDRATSRPSTPRRSAKRSPSPSIPAT